MARSSKAAIFAAITANFLICAAKLIVALITRSMAMLSEALHSGVDGINDILLIYGLRRSQRPADAQHPFGHGKELYFWALIVSCSVLAIGGGLAIVQGIRHILHPSHLQHAGWSYIALACGAAFSGSSFLYSLRKFRRQNAGKGFWEAIDELKDPSVLMVMAEDSSGMIGEIIAAIGIYLQVHGWSRGDGTASLLIGCLLAGTSVFVIAQHRDLIIGEGVEDEIGRSIREIATGEGGFVSIRSARTIFFGPDAVLIAMEVVFDPERKAGELMDAVDRMQRRIREKFPAVQFIYIDPESSREPSSRWQERNLPRAS